MSKKTAIKLWAGDDLCGDRVDAAFCSGYDAAIEDMYLLLLEELPEEEYGDLFRGLRRLDDYDSPLGN